LIAGIVISDWAMDMGVYISFEFVNIKDQKTMKRAMKMSELVKKSTLLQRMERRVAANLHVRP
jgi:hypothetical protein